MRSKEVIADVSAPPGRSFEEVPKNVSDAFFRGLEDVKQGRTVSVTSVLSEGRRLVADSRAGKRKDRADGETS